MKTPLLFIFISVVISCTNSKQQNKLVNEKQIKETPNLIKLKNNINNSGEIITTTISDTKKISELHDYIKTHNNIKYCCCPMDLTMDFYTDSLKKDSYFIDTTTYPNLVIISPLNFNKCTELNKNEWNKLITIK